MKKEGAREEAGDSLGGEELLDVGGRVGVVEVLCREAEGVEKTGGGGRRAVRAARLRDEVAQDGDAAAHVDWGLLVEGALWVEVIVEDDGTGHGPQAEEVSLVGREGLDLHHVLAHVGHRRERVCDVILGHRVVLLEEIDGGLREGIHHGRGVGEEERHAVSQLVADGEIHVLLRELHAVQGTPVVAEIVLNSRVHHLRGDDTPDISNPSRDDKPTSEACADSNLGVIEAEHKVEHVCELLGKGLLRGKALLGSLLAQSKEQLREALLCESVPRSAHHGRDQRMDGDAHRGKGRSRRTPSACPPREGQRSMQILRFRGLVR